MNDGYGIECRVGNRARCGMACGCPCHRQPRSLGAWRNEPAGALHRALRLIVSDRPVREEVAA